MKAEDFAERRPRLVIEDYFAGETRAWGLFQDRFGRLRRQFAVEITGRHEAGLLLLDERFHYDDGEEERRVWRIRRLDEHHWEGRADDVCGMARGVGYGNALNWRYRLRLKVGASEWRVTFDDWMFLQPGGVLLNRARVSKWGIELGTVSIAFTKPGLPDGGG